MSIRIRFKNNDPLLFQFIVKKYLEICQLTKNLETAWQPNVKAVIHHLNNLQFSCHQYLQDEKDHIHNNPQWIENIQKVLDFAYQILKVVQTQSLLADALLLKLQKPLNKLGSLIEKLFLQFRENETVLFFLLEYHAKLSAVYQKSFSSKLFLKMFAGGIKDAEKFLIKKYSSRGYHLLIPQITKFSKEVC